MRALREPDAFPSGDLGLLRALDLRTPRELERRAEAWRPWRAYAAMYLWSGYAKLKASLIDREPAMAALREGQGLTGTSASQT